VSVLQPARIKAPDVQASLLALRPDVQVVVAYGQILPRSIIDIPPLGTVNVHGSLLPRLRGAAPIQWAIAEGYAETGVTTMLIDEGLDTGPILLARKTPIDPRETTADLAPRLAHLGADLLVLTLAGLRDGSVQPRPQDASEATYAPLIRKEDGRLDWGARAEVLARRVRAFDPWPGTHTRLAGRGLKVLRATPDAREHHAPPGSILEVERRGVLVACGEGTSLRLLEVQPESRRAMDAFAFATGSRLVAGVRFEP
jgi:methionyl-tRNA formyltransferase